MEDKNERLNEIISQVSSELNLYPYQVELLKRFVDKDRTAFILYGRLCGRRILKEAYNQIMERYNNEV